MRGVFFRAALLLLLCDDLCIRRHSWLDEASGVVNTEFDAKDLLDAIIAEVDIFRCKWCFSVDGEDPGTQRFAWCRIKKHPSLLTDLDFANTTLGDVATQVNCVGVDERKQCLAPRKNSDILTWPSFALMSRCSKVGWVKGQVKMSGFVVTLHRVNMNFVKTIAIFVSGILSLGMAHSFVLIPPCHQTSVNFIFVRVDQSPRHNCVLNYRCNRGATRKSGVSAWVTWRHKKSRIS